MRPVFGQKRGLLRREFSKENDQERGVASYEGSLARRTTRKGVDLRLGRKGASYEGSLVKKTTRKGPPMKGV